MPTFNFVTLTETEEPNIPLPVRPEMLSVLCIITFASGLIKIMLFLWAILRSNPNYSGENINGLLNFFLGIHSTLYTIIWIAVTVTTMTGAGLIWKLRKSGFYIYVLSVCIAYLLPAISSGADMMTIQRLFVTSAFIFFYGINLKFLKKL